MPRLDLPRWLRRSLEAALVAAVVAIASLVGAGLSAGGEPYALPAGPSGTLLLAPAVLALAVIATAYPVAMAATRGDALLGAIAAVLIAADLTVIFAGSRVVLERSGTTIGGGLLVAALAAIPALVGLAASQVGAAFGFGRRAGALCALAATIAAVLVLALVALYA
jgi:hypothetical protein